MGHVVVVPFPAQGHITPLMEFAHKLSLEVGFTLTIVNTTHNHKRLLQSARTDGLPSNIRLAAVSDGLAPDHPRTASVVEFCKALQASMAPSLINLLLTGVDEEGNRFNSPPFTCVVCDLSLAFGQMVADACELPQVAFWTRSATYFAAMQLVCKGIWHAESAASDLSSHIPGAPPIELSDMSSLLLVKDPSDFAFNFITSPIVGASKAAWILFNTFAELETLVVNALAKDLKVAAIGPILPADFSNDVSLSRSVSTLTSEAHDCIEWLDKKPPNSVLYVSFGSMATLSEMEVREMAFGLESSNHFCLWVARPDLVEAGSLTEFLEGFLESVKERILCVPWAPQLRVLSHASVGGFLTHGGWNSVMEAIAAGVPMLGWPGGADQRANCKCFVDRWGVGLYLEQNESGMVTKEEVQEKVCLLMDEESVGVKLRERAVELKSAATRAISQGGSSHRNWDAFVHGIKLMKFSV